MGSCFKQIFCLPCGGNTLLGAGMEAGSLVQRLPVGVDGGWTGVVATEGSEVVGFESCFKGRTKDLAMYHMRKV